MKIRVLSSLISLVLLVLVIALAAGCSSLYQAEQKLDQVEEQVEQAVTPPTSGNAATLTLEQAQEIALNHAGFHPDQVTNLHGHFDVDDGVPEYEVDFFQDGWEYSYTIHADTGDILEYDKDND
jgi:uncharacterized membrane protein YkoI